MQVGSVETVITGESVVLVKSPIDPCKISCTQEGDVNDVRVIIASRIDCAGSVN